MWDSLGLSGAHKPKSSPSYGTVSSTHRVYLNQQMAAFVVKFQVSFPSPDPSDQLFFHFLKFRLASHQLKFFIADFLPYYADIGGGDEGEAVHAAKVLQGHFESGSEHLGSREGAARLHPAADGGMGRGRVVLTPSRSEKMLNHLSLGSIR